MSLILLTSKIGEGVFKEEWLETNVAVKKVKVKRLKLVKETIVQEVNVHSIKRHPNIVFLMAYSIDKDRL